MKMKKLIAMLSIAAAVLSCAAIIAYAVGNNGGSIELIKDGEAVYSLVYSSLWNKPKDVEDVRKFASDEIGVDIPMYTAETRISDNEIFIGSSRQIMGEHKNRVADGGLYSVDEDVIGDGYVISTSDSRVILSAFSTRGAKNALVCLFKKGLGDDYVDKSDFRAENLSVPADIYVLYSPYVESETQAVMDIGGKDIGEFTLVYSAERAKGEASNEAFFETLNTIRRYIFGITGKTVAMKDDSSEPSENEIVIGRTGRKNFTGLDENDTVISVEGGKLYICGGNDFTTDLACKRFCSEYLKVTDAKYTGGSVIHIPEGLNDTVRSPFAKFSAEGTDQVDYVRDNMEKLLGTDETPCFSDPETADRIYDTIVSSKHRSGEEVFINCNRADWCGCEKCGGKTEAFFETVSKVAERLKEMNIRVAAVAANETRSPSVESISDNVWIYFAEPHVCCAHALNDPSCEENAKIARDLAAWTKISGKVCILDYTMNYLHYPATFPDFHVLRPNFNYYNEIGVNGVLMVWKQDGALLEFGSIRTGLLNALAADPAMDAERFDELENSVIDGLYGSRSGAIKEYIEKFTAASADHFTIFSWPDEIVPIKRIEGKKGAEAYDLTFAKELAGLWERIYDRHDPPRPPLTGTEMEQLELDYYSSDYYLQLHSRVQFTEWLNANIPQVDRYAVFSEIVDSYNK